MLSDTDFGLDHTRLGLFQSAVSIPNLFMPVLGGIFLDHRGSAKGTIIMLSLCLIGHLGFVLACGAKNFHAALIARTLFGLGQGSTVVAQGRICAMFFVGRELVFAIALAESAHNLSNFIAFVYVVPVSEWMGGYIWSLWMGVFFSALSLIAGILFFYFNRELHDDEDGHDENVRPTENITTALEAEERSSLINADRSSGARYNTFVARSSSPTSSIPGTPNSSTSSSAESHGVCMGLSIGFFLVCIIHMIYSNCYHLFAYVSATLIKDRFHTTVNKAGWLAGLSHGLAIFLCPAAGLLMDWLGFKMW